MNQKVIIIAISYDEVVIRNLPTKHISETEFKKYLPCTCTVLSYVVADPGGRCYVRFENPDDLISFYKHFNRHTFITKNRTYVCSVELCIFQKIPKPCKHQNELEGTIQSDPDYIKFLEELENGTKEVIQPIVNETPKVSSLLTQLKEQKKLFDDKSREKREKNSIGSIQSIIQPLQKKKKKNKKIKNDSFGSQKTIKILSSHQESSLGTNQSCIQSSLDQKDMNIKKALKIEKEYVNNEQDSKGRINLNTSFLQTKLNQTNNINSNIMSDNLMKTIDTNLMNINLREMNPIEINPKEMNPKEMNPIESNPKEMNPHSKSINRKKPKSKELNSQSIPIQIQIIKKPKN